MHAPIGLQLRVRVASVLGINLLWSGLFEQIGAMHELLARTIAQQGLSDYGRLVWGLVELDACWAQAPLGDAPAVLQRLAATAQQCGIHALDTDHPLLANDAQLAAGDLAGADALLEEARAALQPTQLTEVWHAAFQAAGLAAWRGDAAAMLRHARTAIDAARAIRSPMCEAFGCIAQVLAHRQRGPPAPAHAIAPDWPRPLQLQLLGGFALAIDGEPLVFQGKLQKRPLELLQALAVRGPAPVPVALLLDDLWPELDGEAARKSFDTTLHRLRKLLGTQAAALRLEAAAVQLDTRRIGCDLWTLRRLADQTPTQLQARPAPAAWVQQHAGAALLPLHAATWVETARQAHAQRVQRRWGDEAAAGARQGPGRGAHAVPVPGVQAPATPLPRGAAPSVGDR